MTTKELTGLYREIIQREGFKVEAKRGDTSRSALGWNGTRQHLLWMLDEMDGMMDSMAQLGAKDLTPKWHRWLGFVQGALWIMYSRTIDEMRDDTRGLTFV